MVSLLMPLVRKTSKTFECQAPRVRGHKYWQAGKVCADHEAACDCDMMMPGSAFSICVWALVMASVLAPTGFGVFLSRRIEFEKKQAALERSSRSMSRDMGATEHKSQA